MDRLKPVEHAFKAFFFGMCKPFLKRKQREFAPLDGTALRKVLFLRPEKIGDMVISFPVFDGLKKHFPHLKISILASPKNLAIIRDDPRFDKIYLYRKNLWKDIKEVAAIRKEKFDCVVDMICDDSVTALFLSQLTAPGKPRIGVGKVKFREYYDFNYDHRRGNTGHIIENTLKVLHAFGIETDSLSGFAPPYISPEAYAKAERFIASLTNGASPVLLTGYNLSAGSPTRIWAEEKSAALVERLVSFRPNQIVVLFAIGKDRQRARRLKEKFPDRVFLIPDKLSLMEASAVISKLDVLISPDTSLVHIARALQVPVVGLYSRFMKNFLLWRPYGQEIGAVVSGNDDNIFDISVDDVYQTYLEVVARHCLVSS